MRSSPETRTGSAKNAGVFSAAVREEYFLNILQSFLITLSMYTVIPMPATEWNGRNLRYCMAFLPAAGFVISAAEWVLFFRMLFFASFGCFFCFVFLRAAGFGYGKNSHRRADRYL